MSEAFNWRRLWLLVRGDAIADYRLMLITAAAVAAAMLIGSVVAVAQGHSSDSYYVSWFMGLLFIGGPIRASYSFAELHDKARNEAYLLLPASALEKTVARLFRATLAFFVLALIFLTFTSAVIEGINWLVFGRRNGIFNPSQEAAWAPVGHFLVAVSLYFAGAAWFRKMHFIKTALTLLAIPIGLACFTVLIGYIVFGAGAFGGGANVELGDGLAYNYYLAHRRLFDALLVSLEFLYFIGLPVFCWVIAWLRVKETQVSHGV